MFKRNQMRRVVKTRKVKEGLVLSGNPTKVRLRGPLFHRRSEGVHLWL